MRVPRPWAVSRVSDPPTALRRSVMLFSPRPRAMGLMRGEVGDRRVVLREAVALCRSALEYGFRFESTSDSARPRDYP